MRTIQIAGAGPSCISTAVSIRVSARTDGSESWRCENASVRKADDEDQAGDSDRRDRDDA
jgi:hypothetical protein